MAREKNSRGNRSGEITYNLIKHIGVVSEYKTGWRRELNIIEWNDNGPKYDLRDWDRKNDHMGKGITFVRAEAEQMCKLLEESFESKDAKMIPDKTDKMI